jgi:DNA-binding CsgD family transcriptional regulator
MLQGLLLLAEGTYPAAEQTLRDAVALVRSLPASAHLHGNPALLLAHLHLVMGRPHRALDELVPILETAEGDNTPGLIAKEGAPMIPLMRLAIAGGVKPDFASRVLLALDVPEEGKPVQVPGTGEVLSPREVELLRLVASGASNRRIAEQLLIGDQTVKTHVSHILRKLDASSRTEAAARARELRLL